MWEAFASFHGVCLLPADPDHVAAFVVARFRAGVGVQALSANLSAVRWFHKRTDVSVDVTVAAREVLNRLAKEKPATGSPAPVLSVGALLAMVGLVPPLGASFSSKLIRFCLPMLKPRQWMAVHRQDVTFASDYSYVDVVLSALPKVRTHRALGHEVVRLVADAGWVACPVRAMRLLWDQAGSGPLFSTKLHSDSKTFHPLTSTDGIHARLMVRDAAIVCVGYGGALRVEELSRARVEDLELLDGAYRLRIPVAKTSQYGEQAVVLYERSDGLDPVVALDRWLAVRGDHDGPLFTALHHCSAQGPPDLSMPADSLRSGIADLAKRVGLPAGVSGHSLRRSWATHCYLTNPNDLGAISLQLRHASTKMTVRYIEDLRIEAMNGIDMLDPLTVRLGTGGQFRPLKGAGFGTDLLSELIDQANELRGHGTSRPVDDKAGESLWNGWVSFATANGLPVLPATPEGLALLVAARADARITPGVIRAQLNQIVRRHRTGGHDTSGIREFADDLVTAYGRTDPVSRRKRVTLLGEADLRMIVSTPPNSFGGARDRVIVSVGYNGAMTAAEFGGARLEDLERTSWGYVLRLQPSGRAPASIVLLPQRTDELDPVAAIDQLIEFSESTSGPLLPTKIGSQTSMGPDGIHDRLEKLGKRCKLKSPLHLGTLRRSWATHAYELGVDLVSVQRHLRHASLPSAENIASLTPWSPSNPAVELMNVCHVGPK
jgi:integrase